MEKRNDAQKYKNYYDTISSVCDCINFWCRDNIKNNLDNIYNYLKSFNFTAWKDEQQKESLEDLADIMLALKVSVVSIEDVYKKADDTILLLDKSLNNLLTNENSYNAKVDEYNQVENSINSTVDKTLLSDLNKKRDEINKSLIEFGKLMDEDILLIDKYIDTINLCNDGEVGDSDTVDSTASILADDIVEEEEPVDIVKDKLVESYKNRKITKALKSDTVVNGRNLTYWAYEPDSNTAGLPLVIYLHGGGSHPDSDGLGKALKNGANMSAVVVSPQRVDRNEFWYNQADFMAYVDEMKEKYGSSSVSIVGYSRGAIEATELAALNPNYFSSCLAIAPSTQSQGVKLDDMASFSNSTTKYWQFVAGRDETFSWDISDNVYEEIYKQGGNAALTKIGKATHTDLDDRVFSGQLFTYKDSDMSPFDFLIS